jgi:Uma2 family endonuclease
VLKSSRPAAGYNARMSTSTREYMDAIEHLPEGATLVLQQFSWQDYERLVEDLTVSHARLRVTYDHGRVEIMSPLNEHEGYARFIDALVRAFAERQKLKVESFGGTTWRRRKLQQGMEADCCYYVTNADRIIGKKQIDLDRDPPPDIVVEIDITTESFSKFHIYAALKVGEIWLSDGKKAQLHFYQLEGKTYHEIKQSRVLTGLQPAMIERALQQSKTQGQTRALETFREELAEVNRSEA